MINANNPQVTSVPQEAPKQLEPVDDTVRQVAYAVGTMVQQAEEALASSHPGWSAFFGELYGLLDSEFSQ